tara:strand:- start:1494 stop:3320 length:1827 start_codon:yes stop_codon:yes gene_type:complete
MSRYRKTMSEAMAEVELNEVGYLQSKLNDKQIQNIKKIWQFKTKSDVTPAVKKMIANMDVPTQLAIKDAGIKHISDLIEGRMSEIDAMRKQGASAAKIAKELGLNIKAVKAILGEEDGDSAQDASDEKPPREKIKENVETWAEAANEMDKKKKKDDVAPDSEAQSATEKTDDKEKLKQQVDQKQAEINRLKAQRETDKAKVAKKETEKMVNPETGEPLLQVGIAYKHMRDKMKREKEEVKEEEIKEFKKMKVTIQDMDKRKKAIADLMKQNLGVSVNGGVIRVDGKGKDLNNFAKDLMNFYGANVVAEETIEEGITPQMIATLKKEYEPFRGKKISAARARQLMNILNKFKDSDLQKLGKENIPFISSGSRSKLAVRNMKFTVKNIEFGEELDEEMFEACWTGYKQVGMKNKGGKQVPNCVPEELNKDDEKVIKKVKDMLKGASDKHAAQAKMIDKALKNEMKKDDAYAIGMAQAKKVMNDEPPLQKKTIKKGHEIADKILKKDENAMSLADIERLKKKGMKIKNENHPAREVYESIAAVRKKADKSGMPYSVLKKVYDRGMAAWRGGHRPGATQVQWALARVNSFVTKSSGTWGGADKDLAKKVKGS